MKVVVITHSLMNLKHLHNINDLSGSVNENWHKAVKYYFVQTNGNIQR